MTAVAESKKASVRAKAGKYMTFTLSGEHYGISIAMLEEVIGEIPITPIPNTPSFITGVINLRGRIIPVIDLRVKLRMKVVDFGRESCILILRIPIREGVFNMGILVEQVDDIRQVESHQISNPPNFGVKVNTMFLDGIVKDDDDQALLLLNAVKALTVKELQQIQDSSDASQSN